MTEHRYSYFASGKDEKGALVTMSGEVQASAYNDAVMKAGNDVVAKGFVLVSIQRINMVSLASPTPRFKALPSPAHAGASAAPKPTPDLVRTKPEEAWSTVAIKCSAARVRKTYPAETE